MSPHEHVHTKEELLSLAESESQDLLGVSWRDATSMLDAGATGIGRKTRPSWTLKRRFAGSTTPQPPRTAALLTTLNSLLRCRSVTVSSTWRGPICRLAR